MSGRTGRVAGSGRPCRAAGPRRPWPASEVSESGVAGCVRTTGRVAATTGPAGAGCAGVENRQPATTPNNTIETNTADRMVASIDRAPEPLESPVLAPVVAGVVVSGFSRTASDGAAPQRHLSTFCGTRRPHAGHTQRDIFSRYRLGGIANTGGGTGPTRDGVFRRTPAGCDGRRRGLLPVLLPRIGPGGGRFRPRA